MRRDTSARVRTLQLPWTSRPRTAPASGPATRRRRSDPRAPARRARPALAAAARGRSRPPRSRGGPARPEVLEVAVEPERPFVSLVGIVVRLIRELDSAAGGDLEVEDVYELHARSRCAPGRKEEGSALEGSSTLPALSSRHSVGLPSPEWPAEYPQFASLVPSQRRGDFQLGGSDPEVIGIPRQRSRFSGRGHADPR